MIVMETDRLVDDYLRRLDAAASALPAHRREELISEIRDHLERFVSDDLQVVCVSCDPMFSLRAWADAQGYFFPLLSDYWPHGEVTRAFGVLNEATGAPIRGTFLIGRDGVVHWTLVNGPGERRDFGELPAEVAALR